MFSNRFYTFKLVVSLVLLLALGMYSRDIEEIRGWMYAARLIACVRFPSACHGEIFTMEARVSASDGQTVMVQVRVADLVKDISYFDQDHPLKVEGDLRDVMHASRFILLGKFDRGGFVHLLKKEERSRVLLVKYAVSLLALALGFFLFIRRYRWQFVPSLGFRAR
ncbi:MAG: hypothetical protein H7835_12660 [Magnetococcus sp. XQGC-1]